MLGLLSGVAAENTDLFELVQAGSRFNNVAGAPFGQILTGLPLVCPVILASALAGFAILTNKPKY